MTSDTIVKTISLILAPVVMITACAMSQNGLIAHYTAISHHLRSGASDGWGSASKISENRSGNKKGAPDWAHLKQ